MDPPCLQLGSCSSGTPETRRQIGNWLYSNAKADKGWSIMPVKAHPTVFPMWWKKAMSPDQGWQVCFCMGPTRQSSFLHLFLGSLVEPCCHGFYSDHSSGHWDVLHIFFALKYYDDVWSKVEPSIHFRLQKRPKRKDMSLFYSPTSDTSVKNPSHSPFAQTSWHESKCTSRVCTSFLRSVTHLGVAGKSFSGCDLATIEKVCLESWLKK